MNELREILSAWRGAGTGGDDAVLVTVVHVTGSAYRRPGARMLIFRDGQRAGSVSGGCLEGEISRKAWWFTESGAPALRVYDTSSDDDAVWEFGLGCNGVVHVFLERLDRNATEMLEFLERRQAAGKDSVVATVVRGELAGVRLLVGDGVLLGGSLRGSAIASQVLSEALDTSRTGQSRMVYLNDAAVFVESIPAPLPLIVFGGGHDTLPLVEAAAALGWSVTVTDPRPAFARPDRFPSAARVSVLRPIDPLFDLTIDSRTAVVLMTHNYPLDLKLVPAILDCDPRYIGLLGPKDRARRLFATIGRAIPEVVHAPAGLDIGSDAPASVALSIVAEIQAVLSGRQGGQLRERRGAIHSPAMEVGAADLVRLEGAIRPAFCETMAGADV